MPTKPFKLITLFFRSWHSYTATTWSLYCLQNNCNSSMFDLMPRMFHWIMSAIALGGRVTTCCLKVRALIFHSSILSEAVPYLVKHWIGSSCPFQDLPPAFFLETCWFGRGGRPGFKIPPTSTRTPSTSSFSDGRALRLPPFTAGKRQSRFVWRCTRSAVLCPAQPYCSQGRSSFVRSKTVFVLTSSQRGGD